MGEHEYFDDKSFQHELENDPDFCLQPTKRQKIIKEFFNVGAGNNSLANSSNSLDMPSTSLLKEETDNRCSDEQLAIEQLSKLALFDGTFYTIAKIAANRVIEAKCELCEPRKNFIRGSREATSNFLKHLKVRHEGSIEQYQLYKVHKKNHARKSVNVNVSGTINATYPTPTPNPVNCEVPLQSTCSISDSSENLSPVAMELDGLIPFVRPSTSSSSSSTTSSAAKKQREKQSTFEYNVSKFATSAMLPLSCIDCDSFKALFSTNIMGNHVDLKFLNKDVFEKKISDTVSMKMKGLKARLSNVPYICIGANIWEIYCYRYLYVTAHWMDDSYQRQTDMLACRRVYGEEIPSRIPGFLREVYDEFEIDEDKIVGIVTNNTTLNYNILVELGKSEDEIFKLRNWVKDTDSHVGNTKKYKLPIDSLNQIAVHDVENAIKADDDLKKLHYSIVEKWYALYIFVKTDESDDNAEAFAATFKQFPFPKIRFWTSFFKTLVDILEKQSVIKDMFKQVKKAKYFTDDELQYIDEYCIVMKPLADTIEYLEKNENNFHGFKFPAILSLKRKYEKLQQNPRLKDLKVLANVISTSLNERFDYLRTVNAKSADAIIAAIVIPSMKLRWLNAVNESDQLSDFKTMHHLVARAINTLSPPSSNNAVNLPVEDDFFEFDDQPKSTNDLYELEISQYLQDSRTNLKMLDGYKMIKKLFLRYNTLISSYGPIDQIFCFELVEHEPKREVFANGLFEKYVLLRNE